jgi:hypothetical protein
MCIKLCMLPLLDKTFEVLAQLRVTEVKCDSVGSTVSRPPLDKQSHGRAHRNRVCGANF